MGSQVTRAARQVAKEMADLIESARKHRDNVVAVRPERMESWLLLLCPPKKPRKVRSPGVKARRATVKQLDALCREVVFLRDEGKCRKCGKTATDWCHVHTRGTHATRWELDNSWAGCRGCHMNFWHKQPMHAARWWKKEIGAARYDDLMLKTSVKGRGGVNFHAVRAYLEQERAKLA
jgi:5-methylcytosine-specific restriction endonuclease McrA